MSFLGLFPSVRERRLAAEEAVSAIERHDKKAAGYLLMKAQQTRSSERRTVYNWQGRLYSNNSDDEEGVRPMISLVCLDGSTLVVHPDFIESIRPGDRGVLVRLINGITEAVEGPYNRVLDLLAEAVSSIRA